jgi:hypothetical protein
MIEEVREDQGEHHKAACDADLPHSDAPNPRDVSSIRLAKAHIGACRRTQRHTGQLSSVKEAP